jgi:signal transduction histidine kinase
MQISRALGGETDPAVILGLVSERARALVSARTLVIEVERAGSLELAAGSGELPAGLIGRRLPLAGTVASVALETRRSQTLSDERNRLRFERHGLGRFGVPASDGLVIPMVFGNEAHGVLVVVDRIDATPFTGAHQELLESFAASAASVLATARSATLEHRRQSLSAAEAERTRWAHELHNETLQGLAHLRLLLGVTQRSGSAGAMAEGIGRALEQLDVDIAKLRALISDLRPPALDELGIEPAVRALADRLERNGLLVDVSVELAHHHGEAPERRAPELETAVYRVVQEALTNASRHGGARHAVVEITETEEGIISLSVRDDGHGFDPSAATSGFGVLAMLERAELLGGSLTVRSATGGPSTITATLPPPRRAPEEAREPGDVIELDRSARAGA